MKAEGEAKTRKKPPRNRRRFEAGLSYRACFVSNICVNFGHKAACEYSDGLNLFSHAPYYEFR